MTDMTLYTIPVCPFCQRVEVMLALNGLAERVRVEVVDITRPRPADYLAKTGGTTSAPVLETAEGQIIKESLVILQYLDDLHPERAVRQRDPYRRAVEGMLVAMASDFVGQGYTQVLNQDPARREELNDKTLAQYARLDAFLRQHAPKGPFLFEDFGWAEVVFAPFFQRFWFLEYYEGFALPRDGRFERVAAWIDACVSHPAAQQVTREQIIKSYYDYAKGAGNGGLLPGRQRSSFAFEPHWSQRPWPPADKYGVSATDAELGLG